MNECLRNGCDDEHFLGIADAIDDSLTHLPSYGGLTYRGFDIPNEKLDGFLNKLETQDVVFKSFISSSPDPSVAEGFAFGNRRDYMPIILSLKGKTGKDISKYSVYGSDESEVLFGRNTKWKATKIWRNIKHEDGGEYTEIELTEY